MAAAVDANGGVIDVETFPVGAKHYAELLAWLEAFGPIDKVGVEGTGSYGAGLSRHLRRHGVAVVEVDRPNRQVRHRKGKSDHIDAVAAARAALSGSATGLPKHRDGNVEAIRVLQIARRSAVDERIQILTRCATSASARMMRSGKRSEGRVLDCHGAICADGGTCTRRWNGLERERGIHRNL